MAFSFTNLNVQLFWREIFFPPSSSSSSYIFLFPLCVPPSFIILMYICEHLGNIHVCVFSAKLLGKENKKKLRQRLSVSFFLHWSLALSEKVAACRVFPRSGDWCVCVPCSLDSITSKSTVTDTFFFVSSKKRKRWTSTETDRGAETFGGRQQVMNPSSWGVWLIHLNETVFIFFLPSKVCMHSKFSGWNRETLLPYSGCW